MISLDLSLVKTQTKTFASALKKAEAALSRLRAPFLQLPNDQKGLKDILSFAKSQKGRWKEVVVLGIGGSALGALAAREALYDPLHSIKDSPRLWVLDNIDPVLTNDLLETLDLKKTLFVVISKSGTTVEPMALLAIVKTALIKKGIKAWQKHFVAVTDPRTGLLRAWAKKEKIPSFPVPQDVGGRFSVLSAVGLLPLALTGGDVKGLLEGARALQKKNLAATLAALQYELDCHGGKNITVMMPYSSGLFKFADWYRQLLAESIGKNKTTGPTPVSALGTTDQHSQLQLYQQGPADKWFLFLEVAAFKKDLRVEGLPKELGFLNGKTLGGILKASCRGTAEALADAKRPSATLTLKTVNAKTLGALFLLFETQVALLGELYGVNPYDQPGVEAGKKRTKKLLGFTLAEMTVVLVVLGLLFGISTRTYLQERGRFRFNDAVDQTLTLIKTARGNAIASKPTGVDPDTRELIPPRGGFGVMIDKTAGQVVLYGNQNETNLNFDEGDTVEARYRLPREAKIGALAAGEASWEKATIVFRPPLAEAALTDNGEEKAEEVVISFDRLSTPFKEGARAIRFRRAAGFPEIVFPENNPTPQ